MGRDDHGHAQKGGAETTAGKGESAAERKVGVERSVRFEGEAKEITLEAWLKIEEGGGGR